MKRDLSQPITDLDGKPFEGASDLCAVVHLALTAPLREDAEKPLDHKLKLYRLAQRTHKGGIGFQAECDVHWFMKRAHVYEQLAGGRQALSERVLAAVETIVSPAVKRA